MARELLVKICSMKGSAIHIVLDKYYFPSIKDLERILRKATENSIFIITGSDQMQRQCGAELLQNGAFKE